MKKYLAGRLGREQGEITALQQKERLSRLLDRVKGKSRSQLKTLKRSVLPYRRMEGLPFSFSLFRMATARKLKSDSWTATFERNDRHMIKFTITKCLWYDTCGELRCPELCEKFCNGDDLTFGSMKTITFRRSKTLGKGGDSCDFHLVNNRKTGP
jgi:hypothetical protein